MKYLFKWFNGMPNAIAVLAVIGIIVFIPACWFVNLYKLVKCDFQAPWKGEVIHGIGLIPLASPVTVWFDDK